MSFLFRSNGQTGTLVNQLLLRCNDLEVLRFNFSCSVGHAVVVAPQLLKNPFATLPDHFRPMRQMLFVSDHNNFGSALQRPREAWQI